jgi:ferrous iron transport protein B
VASALDELERIEADFAEAVEEVETGTPTWRAARRAADERLAAVVERLGRPGRVALEVWQADRALRQALALIDRSESGAFLRDSVLGRMGRWIEPVVRPIGWDWRIGTAVIASFPAREIVVATMGTIYNLGDQEGEVAVGLRTKLREATWSDGRPVFNIAVALSIMVFFALCCQCAATLATIRRETNSWRWPLLTFAYMTALAYVCALATYQIVSRMT